MKITRRFVILLSALVVGSFQARGQEWTRKMQQPNANFYEIKKSFDDYWKNRSYERSQGFKQYKRWEYFWGKRVLPNGQFPKAGIKQIEWKKYIATHPELKRGSGSRTTGNGNWTSLGPNSSPGGYQGVGRINCIGFHPSNANTFYVGTPAGGLWKTTDAGATWSNLTDDLPIIGVSYIAIDPNNANTIYLATGDADGGDTPSIGVLKSTDGGTSWNATGLNWEASLGRRISRLLISPNNSNLLVAATSQGIYKTTDAGTSWTLARSGNFRDLEFKPGDPTIMYATGQGSNSSHQIYKSTNTGDSWTQVTFLNSVNRIAIAVSAANPAFVAAVTSNSNTNGFAGFYASTNSGSSFSLRFSSKNLLGWEFDGSDSRGQGWYDLAITIAPTNANLINVGGVNNWQSTDGGFNWNINTMWFATGKAPEVHADKHDLIYHPLQTGTMFECNDGGIYRTTNSGTTWTDITNGITHTQFYKIGVSQTDASYIVAGAQDNGTKLRAGTSWTNIGGGDGMECIIDPTDKNIQYYSLYYGRITRIKNGTSSVISENIPGRPQGAWVTPYVLDPSNPNTILAGYRDVYRSTNQGDSWTNISNGQLSTNLSAIAVAPSASNTIYATNGRIVYRTTNASSWSNITNNLPVSNAVVTYIAVSLADANIVWVTLSGYSDGNKVFKSTNGGSSWTNISGSLPNLPVNCILHDSNTSDESLYIGTDVGIFYRNNTLGDWISFSNGLPNVVVRELEIQRSSSKLRAGTYGRGLWESDLYNSAAAPNTPSITSFTPTSGDVGTSVTLNGTNFSNASAVKFNGTTATTFNVVSATQVTVTVPTGATTGKIAITTPNGTGVSTLNFSIGTTGGGGGGTTYCESKANSAEDSRIEKVEFNTISNSSSESGNTGNVGCVTYTDFTNVSTNVDPGQSYTLSVTLGTCGSDYSKAVKIFIDYNGDGDFSDTGEEVAASGVMKNGTFTQSITIPSGATIGTTRMRVVCREKESGDADDAAAVANITACGTYSWGETEDYTVVIGTTGSAPGVSSFSPANGSQGTEVTITGTNFTGISAVQFNGTNAASYNVVSSTQITAIVPAGASTGKIKVASAGGSGESTNDFVVSNANYCASGPDPSLESSSDDSRIDRVVFGSIDNTTTSGCATYSDYSSISTSVTAGTTLPITVTLGSCGSDYNKVVKIYIDWNNDLDFDDAGEQIGASGVMNNGDYTTNVTVPSSATNGTVRMRIVCRERVSTDASEQDAIDNTQACGLYAWGETQDYSVAIGGGSGGIALLL